MKHFGKNALLFANTSAAGGHKEFVSNVTMVSANSSSKYELFRIWKNRDSWILMLHDGVDFAASEVKCFTKPFDAMSYAKVRYLSIDLEDSTYMIADRAEVLVEDKGNIICDIRGKTIYGVKKEYRKFSEYGGEKLPWQ